MAATSPLKTFVNALWTLLDADADVGSAAVLKGAVMQLRESQSVVIVPKSIEETARAIGGAYADELTVEVWVMQRFADTEANVDDHLDLTEAVRNAVEADRQMSSAYEEVTIGEITFSLASLASDENIYRRAVIPMTARLAQT